MAVQYSVAYVSCGFPLSLLHVGCFRFEAILHPAMNIIVLAGIRDCCTQREASSFPWISQCLLCSCLWDISVIWLAYVTGQGEWDRRQSPLPHFCPFIMKCWHSPHSIWLDFDFVVLDCLWTYSFPIVGNTAIPLETQRLKGPNYLQRQSIYTKSSHTNAW